MPADVALAGSLALAERALAAVAFAAPEDPLRLELPGLEPGDRPDAHTMSVVGALYLYGELEETGVVVAAELLADERDTFLLADEGAALRLEEFARRRREWPDRAARERLYARLFGFGDGATASAGGLVNRGFHTRLGALCHALSAHGRYDTRPAAISLSAVALLDGLRTRGLGSALVAARRHALQTRRALELLGDPGIGNLVGGRGTWDVLGRLYGAGAPDVRSLVERGQSGQYVLGWAGAAFGRAAAADPPITDAAVRAADTWLLASGVELARAAA